MIEWTEMEKECVEEGEYILAFVVVLDDEGRYSDQQHPPIVLYSSRGRIFNTKEFSFIWCENKQRWIDNHGFNFVITHYSYIDKP